jgi:DNA-binding Lrp family transcriptional regulator
MDVINRRILSHLLRNGRATFQQVGAEVGLSAPAVKRRVDALLSSGKIKGFTALVDPGALGWTTEAYVEVYYRGNVSTADLKRSLEHIPQIVGAWTVSGDADALVHVMAETMAEVESTVERIRENTRVDRTRSAIVMSRVFERPRS